LTITTTLSFCQYTKTERSTKTIVQERSIYLNGGTRASVGGKSRVVIPFDLPQNTVEWYYSFSTSEGTSGTKKLNLAIQLSTLLVDQTGTTANLMNQVKVPSGSSGIDVYLLNSENQNAFEEKWDNNGGTFYFISEGTVKNTKQAIVKVDDVKSGRWYLGLKNPSSLDGVNTFVEITAVIQNDVYVDEWTIENKNKLKSNCLAGFYTQSTGKNDVCDCLLGKITTQNLPSQWNKQDSNTRNIINNSFIESCYYETGNSSLKNAEVEYEKQANYKSLIEKADKMRNSGDLEEAVKAYSEASLLITEEQYPKEQITELNEKIEIIKLERAQLQSSIDNVNTIIKEAHAASAISDYSDARSKMSSALELIINDKKLKDSYGSERIARFYNSAAWWSILLNELDDAGDFLKKGLSNDSQNMYLRGNLGLFHLLKGNYSEAEKAFLYYKRKEKLSNGKKWGDVIAEDLKLLESKGMGNSDFKKIRTLLKIK
ncbi:MAG: hypothetical protein QMB65_13510, partial [Vicingaceae bacterium]